MKPQQWNVRTVISSVLKESLKKKKFGRHKLYLIIIIIFVLLIMTSKENICKEEDQNGLNEEPKKKEKVNEKKMLRILTVMGYLISVSTPALILSSYYIFLWESIDHRNTTAQPKKT